MYQSPQPSHGFFGVTVAFLAYIALVVGLGVFLTDTGFSTPIVYATTFLFAFLLFAGFLPLFRRLTPEQAGEE